MIRRQSSQRRGTQTSDERIFKKGLYFANGLKDKGLEQAMVFLDNEENENKVLERGKNIAAYLFKWGMNAKVMKR